MMILHVCRQVLCVRVNVKAIVYFLVILCGSAMSDFVPFPRTYFALKTNFLNVYFVKFSWGWTILLLGSFVLLTSYVYCCGEKSKIRYHMSRLVVATALWYILTGLFGYIEGITGICSMRSEKCATKLACIKNGHRWYGFDISGHAFILVYCNLLILEEIAVIKGWERICHLLRTSEYDDDSPLKCLTDEEVTIMRTAYSIFTPYIRALFILLTLLHLLWDFMLLMTVLYYHSLAQKLVGCLFAIVAWYVTYYIWYPVSIPGLPGPTAFRYSNVNPGIARRKTEAGHSHQHVF